MLFTEAYIIGRLSSMAGSDRIVTTLSLTSQLQLASQYLLVVLYNVQA